MRLLITSLSAKWRLTGDRHWPSLKVDGVVSLPTRAGDEIVVETGLSTGSNLPLLPVAQQREHWCDSCTSATLLPWSRQSRLALGYCPTER